MRRAEHCQIQKTLQRHTQINDAETYPKNAAEIYPKNDAETSQKNDAETYPKNAAKTYPKNGFLFGTQNVAPKK